MKNQPKDYVDAQERMQDDDLPSLRWWVGYVVILILGIMTIIYVSQ